MSIDVSLASPTSPPSDEGTLSAWDALQPALAAERATRAAAAAAQAHRDIAEHAAKPRTVADVEADIRRYNGQLKAEPVLRNLRWYFDVTAKRDAAETELATLQAGGAL